MSFDRFPNMTEDISKKLNALNGAIVFHYYMKYKGSRYSKCIDINNDTISLANYFKGRKGTKSGDRTEQLVMHFPYYYKMLNLYAHFCAILDLEEDENAFA